MTDPLAAAIERLANVLERLEQKLDAQLPETGTKRDAARMLGVSVKTLERRISELTPEVHYWHEGRKLVFDLELLRDWQRNHNNPAIHQRAIEAKRKQLLSQRKKA